MAEAVGLAFGTIALASLFSTCIEVIEYFDLGKSQEYDYDLACLKLSLLKSRLDTWGRSLCIHDAGHEVEELRHNWSQEKHVIMRSLSGINDIFGNADLLKDKYRLTPRKPNVITTLLGIRKQSNNLSQSRKSSTPPEILPVQPHSYLRRLTKWAIRDKEKFDCLLSDLEFLISNLEHVVTRLIMSDKSRDISAKPEGDDNIRKAASKAERDEAARVKRELDTIFEDSTKLTQKMREQSVDNSQHTGKSSSKGGRSFEIKKISDQALGLHGVHGSTRVDPNPEGHHDWFTLGEIKDQGTGIQGYISEQSTRDALQSHQATIQSAQPMKQRMTSNKNGSATHFHGKGQQLGQSG